METIAITGDPRASRPSPGWTVPGDGGAIQADGAVRTDADVIAIDGAGRVGHAHNAAVMAVATDG